MRSSSKGIKNLIYGTVGQVIILAMGFVLPRLFMVNYGSEVNGLLTSVKQLFAYMVLLEAGVGATTLQALYKPMAESDHKRMSSILAATSSYYKKTGIAYAVLVLVIALSYSSVVSTSIPFYMVFSVIVLHGAAGVIKYLFQGKFTLLMQVDGKNYILSNLTLFVTILSDIAQIVLIFCGFDIVAVKLAYFIINLIQMVFIVYYVKKHYKWIDLKAEPDYPALSQKNSALVHSISGLVFNNTDTLILTICCGLSIVSVYSVYALVFGIMASIVDVILNSFTYALGQMFHSDRQKFERMQDSYEAAYLAITFAFLTVIYIFITPFISLYTDSITDVVYVDRWLPILFVVMNALNYGRKVSNQTINYAGHFKETQGRAICEMMINIVVSLLGVYLWGIYGVVIGTIAALLYRTNDIIIYANVKILHRKPFKTYMKWLINIATLLVMVMVIGQFNLNINTYWDLIKYGVLIAPVVFLIFIAMPFAYDKNIRSIAKAFIGKKK